MPTPLTTAIGLQTATQFRLEGRFQVDTETVVVTAELLDSSGVVVKTIQRSGTYLQFGLTPAQAAGIKQRLVAFLTAAGDIN